MRALVLLLLLAACGTTMPPPQPGPVETGLNARIGGSATAYYTHSR